MPKGVWELLRGGMENVAVLELDVTDGVLPMVGRKKTAL